MYAVRIPGLDHLAMTVDDPRQDGFDVPVLDNLTLELPDGVETLEEMYLWPTGADAPDPCLGHDPANPTRLKVFWNSSDCRLAGFVQYALNFSLHGSWKEVDKVLA